MARWGFRSRTRPRIPVSCSTAIPRPVRWASATMRLEIWWLRSAAKRASLRRRFFNSRRAELVFFGLQPLTQPLLAFAVPVKPGTRRPVAVAGGGDVDDAQINPDKPVDRIGRRHLGHLDGGVQEPFAISVDQIGLPGRAASAAAPDPVGSRGSEHLSAVRESSRSIPSPPHRRQCLRELPGQAPCIERLRRIDAEADGLV